MLDAERTQHKIRLSGIDAPEKAQAFGEPSKQNLSRLVFGKEIAVRWTKRDRYGRIVGKVLVAEAACKAGDCPKTVDACLSQVHVGMAWWYRDYAREQSGDDAQRYRLAEEDAHTRKVGLWAQPEPMPPWDWRKTKKQHQTFQNIDSSYTVISYSIHDVIPLGHFSCISSSSRPCPLAEGSLGAV